MSSRLKTLKSTDDDPNCQTTAVPYLPDNVIEKILSSLPIDLAAQANTVSKQWAALWPSFPVIVFDEGDPVNYECYFKRQRFLRILHYSLRRCKDQRLLHKLTIRANLQLGDDVLVGEWIEFAIQRYVKELYLQDLDQNRVNKFGKNFLIDHDVLTLKSLTSLSLMNVRLYASCGINGPVSLPSLKTMSLKDVTFLDDRDDTDIYALPSLVSGCPCLEHLSIHDCKLGYSTFRLEISSRSLKSLEIMHCHSLEISVTTKSLESFTFYSDCNCGYHKIMYLWECDSLKHVDISCKGLRQLLLHNCLETMENSLYTPKMEIFEFSGYLKTKVHFVEVPLNLVNTIIRVWETLWPIEYYSAMRDFLESFDCSRKVKIHIEDAEGVIIPEHCRKKWSPPLPSIWQLQLYFSAPLGDAEYCLRPSLLWMAPSAEVLPFLHNDDDGDDFEDMVDHYINDHNEDVDVDDNED